MKHLTSENFKEILEKLFKEHEFDACNIKVTEVEITFPNGEKGFNEHRGYYDVIHQLGKTNANFTANKSYNPPFVETGNRVRKPHWSKITLNIDTL